VGCNAVLTGFGEVVGQQQQTFGAQAFSLLGIFDGLACRTANTGEDRHAGGASINSGLYHLGIFAGRQGEKLTRAACGEQCGGAVRGQPFKTLDIARLVEVTLGVEIGHRERQQTVGEDGLQFLWIHYSNTLGKDFLSKDCCWFWQCRTSSYNYKKIRQLQFIDLRFKRC